MINLLPPEYKASIKFARYNVALLRYCLLILAVSVGIASIMFFGVAFVKAGESNLTSEIEVKQASLSQKGNVEAEAKSLAADINTISSLLDRSINFSDLIQSIGAVIPQGARLTGLSLTGDSSSPLQITAITDTQEKAAVMRQNLEDSGVFSGADIQTITPRDSETGARTYTAIFVTTFADKTDDKAAEQLDPNAEIPEEEQD